MKATVTENIPPTIGQLIALIEEAYELGAPSTAEVRVTAPTPGDPPYAPATPARIEITWDKT